MCHSRCVLPVASCFFGVRPLTKRRGFRTNGQNGSVGRRFAEVVPAARRQPWTPATLGGVSISTENIITQSLTQQLIIKQSTATNIHK